MKKVKVKKRKSKKKKNKVSIKKLCKAIQGSGGVKKVIAERLDITYNSLMKKLRKVKETHPIVEQMFIEEQERVGDIAEQTVIEMMEQGLHYPTKLKAAQFALSGKHSKRGYTNKKEVTLEGGKNPLHIKNENVLPIDDLDLPLETRKQILEAIEEKEKEEKEDG